MDCQIVLLSDSKLIKERKKEELLFYTNQLNVLVEKRMFLDAQIDLTTRIITMVEKELL